MSPIPEALSSFSGVAIGRPCITLASMTVWLPEFCGRWKAMIASSVPPTCFQLVS